MTAFVIVCLILYAAALAVIWLTDAAEKAERLDREALTVQAAVARIAATWGLPPTCTCPNDCDCDGILVCLICWARSKPHRAGQEDHADLEVSLAAISDGRWSM